MAWPIITTTSIPPPFSPPRVIIGHRMALAPLRVCVSAGPFLSCSVSAIWGLGGEEKECLFCHGRRRKEEEALREKGREAKGGEGRSSLYSFQSWRLRRGERTDGRVHVGEEEERKSKVRRRVYSHCRDSPTSTSPPYPPTP